MSAPQLIAPLLDGFVMGDPISSHDGVRACPAMKLETDEKYIVKIISLPATQTKMAALLLAGAFTDRESALEYFKELADGVVDEAELLQKLARNEGFVPFENWQMVPMEDGETGFDIYLLSPYRPTLENALRTNELTHLQAINLGLDLCTALSVSRRFGYLYSNLRPSNIYICNDREFRIGDLGFLSLDSLQYASLPDKYRSDYTPPEISDAFSTLNATMDTYAVGLILYQAYNDGRLPPVGGAMDVPKYADPALAEIILKACAVNPEDRWQDPVQMGQALASYMQSNSVNDTPIVPIVEEEETEPEPIFPDEDTEPSTDDILAEVDQALETAPEIIPAAPKEEEIPQEAADEEVEIPEEAEKEEPAQEEPAPEEEEIPEIPVTDVPDEVTVSEEPVEEPLAEEEAAEEESAEEEPDEEEALEEAPEEVVEEEPVDETAQMLAQADELIAYQLPDPPVAPDPIEVTLPKPEVAQPEAEEVVEEIPVEEAEASAEENSEPAEEETEAAESAEDEEQPQQPRKSRRKLLVTAIILASVLLLGAAAFLFYQFFYLQTIDSISVTGYRDTLTVTLDTDTNNDKLVVWCTDTHGNTLKQDVNGNKAYFTGLKSGTNYTIEVRINGMHKLLGEIKTDYTTETQTNITGFYANTGPEDGSVILSFTPQGPTSEQWTLTYSAEGEESRTMTFKGHMTTVTGLTANKEYTFTIEPVSSLYVTGTTSITYTASKPVYPENVQILGFANGKLVLTWNAPEDTKVSKWFVRCYNDNGFDQTLSAEETAIVFENLDTTVDYNVEVMAEGMTLGGKITAAANSVTVKNLQVDASNPSELKISWEYEGAQAESSAERKLIFTVDGKTEQITCSGTTAVLSPVVPGAKYTIHIGGAADEVIYGTELVYDAPAAKSFSNYSVKASDMEFSMCKTPKKTDWTRKDVPSGDYTTTFKAGTSASFVMHLNKKTTKTDNQVVTLYIVRDADGKLLSAATESRTWDDMWDDRYGELTLPQMPSAAGSYTVEIYFDGASVTTQGFTVQ